MPAPAGASNLAWEFVWGFMITTNLGLVFVWGLRIWFFLDLFIFYTILRYGKKQMSTPLFKNKFIWWEVAATLLWVPAFYLFFQEGYDTAMGATSAYMITVIMAFLYVMFYASSGKNQVYYSARAAWCKGIGNTLMSIFVFLHYPEMKFLQLLCVVVFLLNAGYIVLISRQRLKEAPVKNLVRGKRPVMGAV
jgi:signal transduction histidine kinase